MLRLSLVRLALAMLAAVGLLAQSAQSPPAPKGDIAALLEPIRTAHKLPAMGGAIVTSKGLVEAGVTGVRKAGTTTAVTLDDLWHLGSDTKAMTAVVIAKLVERGKLSWETSVMDVFPALPSDATSEFRHLTLLQLLSHRAGLPANINWQVAAKSDPSPRTERLNALRTAASTPLLSKPGSTYAYSNLGYVIAATMAERVADKAWEDLVREIVFEPLGMTSAGFGGLGTKGQIDQPWPHFANGEPALANGPDMDNPEVMGPAGTVHCSIGDWAKFVADQLRAGTGEGALLKADGYARLRTAPFGGDYALGWLVADRPWGGGKVYTHAGSNTMNYAVVWMAPAKDFAVLVTTNEGGPEAQKACDEAASALIRRHLAVPPRAGQGPPACFRSSVRCFCSLCEIR